MFGLTKNLMILTLTTFFLAEKVSNQVQNLLTHRFVSLVGRYTAKIGIGPPLEAMANPLLFVVMLQATATTTTKSLLCFFRFLRPKNEEEKYRENKGKTWQQLFL